MPVTKKQKPTRGIPRKAQNSARHARQAHYLARSTCARCQLIFRSPKFRTNHVANGHTSLVGVNKKRCTLEQWKLLTKGGALGLSN